MLLYLTQYLSQFESGFNVFNYLTMRAILGALTALVLSFVGLAGLFTLRDGILPRRLSGAGLAAVTTALAGLSFVSSPRADAAYLGHTMPGLWSRVTTPGESVPTDDPAPDPAGRSLLGRWIHRSRRRRTIHHYLDGGGRLRHATSRCERHHEQRGADARDARPQLF